MPLSLSTSNLSRYCALDPAFIAPVISINLSASVLFPWSIWAMILKFRIYTSKIGLSLQTIFSNTCPIHSTPPPPPFAFFPSFFRHIWISSEEYWRGLYVRQVSKFCVACHVSRKIGHVQTVYNFTLTSFSHWHWSPAAEDGANDGDIWYLFFCGNLGVNNIC